MTKIQKKSLNTPDDTKAYDKFKVDFAKFDQLTFGRSTLQPGWKWSVDMKPIVNTESCQVPHTLYQISGITHVKMNDGEEMEFQPGDAGIIPSGHDAWVVGDEPAVAIDFTGQAGFAKPEN